MEAPKPLPIARLHELFECDPEKGLLHARIPRHGVKVGKIMGTFDASRGYIVVGVDGRKMKVHRIIYAMTHGHDPLYIDHFNGIKTDNRISNLRDVSHQRNTFNAPCKKNNFLGIKGVYRNGSGFFAKLEHKKRLVWSPIVHTIEEAMEYRAFMEELFHEELGVGSNRNRSL